MNASRLSIDENSPRELKVSGVIDAHTAEALETALTRQGTDGDVTLDLRSIDFIDSSGLRVIVTFHQRLGDAGNRLVLGGPSESVMRLLEITGLRDHLHLSE